MGHKGKVVRVSAGRLPKGDDIRAGSKRADRWRPGSKAAVVAPQSGLWCQGGPHGVEVRETIWMKPDRKLLQTPFRKYMHNPLTMAQTRTLEKKKRKDLHFNILEDLVGLQCSTTKNQKSWINMLYLHQHLRHYCQIIKRHNGEGGSFSRKNSRSSLHTLSSNISPQ